MLWCKHDWEIKVKETLPSAWEQIAATTNKVQVPVDLNLFEKKLVVILSCRKCGILDKTIETSPRSRSLWEETVWKQFS